MRRDSFASSHFWQLSKSVVRLLCFLRPLLLTRSNISSSRIEEKNFSLSVERITSPTNNRHANQWLESQSLIVICLSTSVSHIDLHEETLAKSQIDMSGWRIVVNVSHPQCLYCCPLLCHCDQSNGLVFGWKSGNCLKCFWWKSLLGSIVNWFVRKDQISVFL